MSRELPSFDLIVATVSRVDELSRLLASLEAQEYRRVRVIVVDQNDDARVVALIGNCDLDVLHLRSQRGLSRARNLGLEHVTADVVAFPDDDCVYSPTLLTRVAERFSVDSRIDGLTGRAEDELGRSGSSWKPDPAVLTDDNLWNRAISFTIFLRRELVEGVGGFDEQLGLGSGTPWSSGEEVDYLVRAVRAGGKIAYDPDLTILHDLRPLDAEGRRAVGYRDGASVGYLLRKHGYGRRTRARMLVRPAGGALLSLLRLDPAQARVHLATLRGRVVGYRARPK